ncbi:MAG TPA: DUF1634 domain-containing protein [Pirellulales bacterium]
MPTAPQPHDAAADQPGTWSDTHVEQVMGNLLRAGVILAAAIVLIGGMIYLIRHPGQEPDHHLFHGEPKSLTSVWSVIELAFAGSAGGLTQLGLLALIATPIARVVFSVYAFARQRDFMYVGITLIVLALLVYSLAWGRL